MAFAFEQSHVRVAAEANIQIAVGRDFLAKPHVAGVKPVVAAGGDNFFAARRGRRRRRFGKTFQFLRRKNAVGDFVLAGEFPARGILRQRVVRPNVGAQAFRQRIGIFRRVRFDNSADVADGIQKIVSFRQGKFRRLAVELLQDRIRPQQHGEFAELRGFFEKTQIARLDVVEPAADHDIFLRGHFYRGKPLKRFSSLSSAATGLKPGVNEMLFIGEIL